MSVIFGVRPSVRFPRRMVPICVNDPIGLAIPFRMANTPAIVVVLTGAQADQQHAQPSARRSDFNR